MSHQTGIKANDKLTKVFSKSRNGKLRVIKVSIENEELTCSGTAEVKKDWEKDYDKLVTPFIEESLPCYILYRLDTKTSLGHGWLLITWVPDSATIRQKMMYASTKATLKMEFGSAHITEELHATTMDETTLDGYKRNKLAFSAPAPLTTREEELAELRKSELNTEVNIDTRKQTISAIFCPISEDTLAVIKDFIGNSYDYIQFRVDLEDVRIHVTHAAVVALSDLPKQVPGDHARYHLYRFKHTHEGDYMESIVFIYSMPGYACPVRERMTYSSCKNPFLDNLKDLGVEVTKKIEIDEGSELTEEYLLDQLHPKTVIHRQAFMKPKGPPNRGAKRITRTQDE